MDRTGDVRGDPEIGCNILNGPFFFDEADWIPVPEGWAPNIVRGRTFDTANNEGMHLWDAVAERLGRTGASGHVMDEPARYGADYLARARLGQRAFPGVITDAFHRR